MADGHIFVTPTGAGLQDGTDIENAYALVDVARPTTLHGLRTAAVDDINYIYFIDGTFTADVELGVGGTSNWEFNSSYTDANIASNIITPASGTAIVDGDFNLVGTANTVAVQHNKHIGDCTYINMTFALDSQYAIKITDSPGNIIVDNIIVNGDSATTINGIVWSNTDVNPTYSMEDSYLKVTNSSFSGCYATNGAIAVSAANGNDVSDITIENCLFDGNRQQVKLRASNGGFDDTGNIHNVRIRSCAFINGGDIGTLDITHGSDPSISLILDTSVCYDVIVEDCLFYNNERVGIVSFRSIDWIPTGGFIHTQSAAMVDGNGDWVQGDYPVIVRRCKFDTNSIAASPGSMENIGAQGLIFEECELVNGGNGNAEPAANDGVGLWYDMAFNDADSIPAQRCVYRHNYIRRHNWSQEQFETADFEHGGSSNGLTDYGSSGLRFLGTQHSAAYGNIIEGCVNGIQIGNSGSPDGIWYSNGNKIFNNTFLNTKVVALHFKTLNDGLATNQIYNNAFINNGRYCATDGLDWCNTYYALGATTIPRVIDNCYFEGFTPPQTGTINNAGTDPWPTDKFASGNIVSNNEVNSGHGMNVVDTANGTITNDAGTLIQISFDPIGYESGDIVSVEGSNSTPPIDGFHTITKITESQGTIQIANSSGAIAVTAGTAGNITFFHQVRGRGLAAASELIPSSASTLKNAGKITDDTIGLKDMFGNSLEGHIGALAPKQ